MNPHPLLPHHKSFSASREMNNVVDRYFSLNRTLLLALGLWPYEKSKFVQLQIICIFSILITCIIFQLTSIITSKYTAEFIIKILSSVFVFIAFVIKYNSFYVNSDTVRCLTEQVQHIYNNLRDVNEFAIVERYGSNAKYYTTVLIMFLFFSILVFTIAQLSPYIIKIVLSTNMTQPHRLQISTEYFIDQEKYFYLLFFHVNIAMGIGIFILIATGTMLITYLQHACAMFKIASYRIEKAIQIYTSKNIKKVKNKILVYKYIIRAVDIHRKAMTFSHYLISRFEISFMFLIAIGVLTLSLNIFRIVLLGYNVEELFINLVVASLSIVYMFLANLVGQQIIDHNNYIFVTAYKVRWYLTSLRIQKMILFLLQRGNKSFGLSVGGLFIASLECFATLSNASVSYFTIMYSMR